MGLPLIDSNVISPLGRPPEPPRAANHSKAPRGGSTRLPPIVGGSEPDPDRGGHVAASRWAACGKIAGASSPTGRRLNKTFAEPIQQVPDE